MARVIRTVASGTTVATGVQYMPSTSSVVKQVVKSAALTLQLPDEILTTHDQCSKLVDSDVTSPSHADGLDSPRLEFAEFQRKAKLLADEFYCARDVPGMINSIAALNCPSFHDELVAILLRTSFDRNDSERDSVVALLAALHSDQLLSAAQIVRAFEKLIISWKDLALDAPDTPSHIMKLMSSNWSKVGCLDQGLAIKLPEDLLRKFSSSLAPGAGRDTLLAHVEKLSSFKVELAAQLETQLFGNQSVEAFGTWLRSQDSADFHHEVLVQACLGSLDTPTLVLAEQRRLMVQAMLVQFHSSDENWLLDEVDLQLGFSRLLGKMTDMADDKPYSQDTLVALLRTAVERELLPAEFLKSARRMRFGGGLGVEVVKEVQRLTPMHSRRIWGAGDSRQFRKEVRQAILEYFDSKSIEELAQIVQELHLNEKEQAQFMKKLMITGMERKEPPAVTLDPIAALLNLCWFQKEVSDAFVQLRESSSDLVLDFPHCRESIDALIGAAVARDLLEQTDIVCDGVAQNV